VLPGVVGLIQATEIIKMILDGGDPLIGRLLLYDAMKMDFKEVRIRKDPECTLCGEFPSVTKLIDYKAFCDITIPGTKFRGEIDEVEYDLSPREFKEAMEKDPSAVLVDVREPFEWDICRIDGAQLLPLSGFDTAKSKLDPDKTIYLYCYKGKRSMLALKKLKNDGYKNLKNLKGGIDLWAETIDPEMPQY